MKIIRAIILISIGSSSSAREIYDCEAYCERSYKTPESRSLCIRALEGMVIDCKRSMDFLQEDAASPKNEMKESNGSNGLGVRSSINNCEAYCSDTYRNSFTQAYCVSVLESIGVDCSRDMDFLQETAASFETANTGIEESKGKGARFRVSLSRSNSNLRGSAFHLASDDLADSDLNDKVTDVTHALDDSSIKIESTDIGAKEYTSEFEESVESPTCRPEGAFCTFSSSCCPGLQCVAYSGPGIFCTRV